MTLLRIARLRRIHGLTWQQAALLAALAWGMRGD